MTEENSELVDKPYATFTLGDKIKILEIVVKLFDQECDRMWRRFSAILTVNAIFVALLRFSGDNADPFIFILSGLFGLALCFCWDRIMVISRYYEVRWQKDMVAIVESDPHLADFLRGRSDKTSRVVRPLPQGSWFYGRWIIRLVAAVWLGILIYGVILAVSG